MIVLDAGPDPTPALELAAHLDQEWPGISIILVSEVAPEIGLAAMRAGVRDILHPDPMCRTSGPCSSEPETLPRPAL